MPSHLPATRNFRHGTFATILLLFALLGLSSAATNYTGVSAFAAPSSIGQPIMFGCGVALSPPTGALLAAAGFDAATNGSFLAIYRRSGYSGYPYALVQVLEQPNVIPTGVLHAAQYKLLSASCPVQLGSDGRVVTWAWSMTGTSLAVPSTGAVYVAYLDSYTDEYVLTQTLREPGIAYNSTLTTYGVFGAAISLMQDYRILMVSSWFYNYPPIGSNQPTSKIYFYALGNNGTAWPPFFEPTSQSNVSDSFCSGCSATSGNMYGLSLGTDALANLLVVGAPFDHNSNHDGSSYTYVQKLGVGQSSPVGAYYNFIQQVNPPDLNGNYGHSTVVSPDGYYSLLGSPIVGSTQGDSFIYTVRGLQNSPFYSPSSPIGEAKDISVGAGLLQGNSGSVSAGSGVVVLAAATPYGGQAGTEGLITIYTYITSPTVATKIQQVVPFGSAFAAQPYATVGYSSTVVSWDGISVASGAPGVDDGAAPVPVQTGAVYVWANATGSTPVATVTPVSCNLAGLVGGLELSCYATPEEADLSFDIPAFLAENPSLDPCKNQTSGVGTVAGYVSWPAGFVTPAGILHGNDGATCGQDQASVAVYVYCSTNASWDCAIPNALNVTRVSTVSATRGSIRAVRNNVFFLYNPADTPGALEGSGLSTGGIIAIVVASVTVAVLVYLVMYRMRRDSMRNVLTV